MNWGDLRWPEFEKLDKEKVVVVPLGSVEQHGRHLPVITDTMLVSEIADRVEERLTRDVIVLPTFWLGASAHHMDFPGTLSLPGALYAQVVKELARSILKAGFRRIIFLCGHGGNEAPAQQALADLVAESEEANDALLAASCYWKLADTALRPEQHGMKQPQLTHSCEYETSLVLAVDPDLVSMKDVSAPPPALDTRWWNSETGGTVRIFKRFRKLTATGAMGLPADATPGKGDSLLDAITEQVVQFLHDFAEMPLL